MLSFFLRFQIHISCFVVLSDTYFVILLHFQIIHQICNNTYFIFFIFIKATCTQLRSYNAKERGFRCKSIFGHFQSVFLFIFYFQSYAYTQHRNYNAKRRNFGNFMAQVLFDEFDSNKPQNLHFCEKE